MAEPIKTPFGLWTRVGRRKHKFNHISQVAPMCPRWRHLANMTEPSVCSSDAVLCQITLTTCSKWWLSTILDLLYACLYHAGRLFHGLYYCVKSGWNQCGSFDNMQVLIFCEICLKMIIYTHLYGFLGDLTKVGSNINATLEGTSCSQMQSKSNISPLLWLVRLKKIPKKKKIKNLTMANWVFIQTT